MNPTTTFGEILAKHRERLGETVTLDELFDLHDAATGSGSLSEDERIELLDRVAADPEAARKLRALMRFSETTAREEAEGVEERWTAFQGELDSPQDSRPADLTEEAEGSVLRFPSGGSRSRLRYAGLAASLVLYSLLLFFFGRVQGPGSGGDPAGLMVNTPIVELTTDQAAHRGAARIAWPSNAQALVVVLSAPEISSRRSLDLAILDADGEPISRRSGIEPDEAGLYSATLHREMMGSGLYEIQLQDDQREVLASFPIEISSTP